MGRATFHKAGHQKRFHVIETLTAMLQKEPSIVFPFSTDPFFSNLSFAISTSESSWPSTIPQTI